MDITEMTERHNALANASCPACGSNSVSSFYTVLDVPVNSCILMSTPEEAISYPKGDIDLHFCSDCGFVFNAKFEEHLTEYSERYEETQGFSDTFNAFHRKLAEQLIKKHDLHGKEVIEIGCGKGEFLTLLCDLGDNHGVGFDPSYVFERSRAANSERTKFVADFFSERYADHSADFLCCKMTLEHIPRVASFVSMVRAAAGNRADTVVFFQVPEASVILDQCRFWDIYYEHCSYFSPESLSFLFRRCGFHMEDIWVDYDDQYLMMEAVPSQTPREMGASETHSATRKLEEKVEAFGRQVRVAVADWQERIEGLSAQGQRIVLWGSGSKAVSFLTTLGLKEQIGSVVDINPHRQGKFMPGTGHQIVAPDSLGQSQPDAIIIMNPVYRKEISAELEAMGLKPQIFTL